VSYYIFCCSNSLLLLYSITLLLVYFTAVYCSTTRVSIALSLSLTGELALLVIRTDCHRATNLHPSTTVYVGYEEQVGLSVLVVQKPGEPRPIQPEAVRVVGVPLPAGLEEHQPELWVTLHGLELVDALQQPGHYHPARLEAAPEDNYGELVLTVVRGPHAVVQRAPRLRGLLHHGAAVLHVTDHGEDQVPHEATDRRIAEQACVHNAQSIRK
jgi:hypothetical protein